MPSACCTNCFWASKVFVFKSLGAGLPKDRVSGICLRRPSTVYTKPGEHGVLEAGLYSVNRHRHTTTATSKAAMQAPTVTPAMDSGRHGRRPWLPAFDMVLFNCLLTTHTRTTRMSRKQNKDDHQRDSNVSESGCLGRRPSLRLGQTLFFIAYC